MPSLAAREAERAGCLRALRTQTLDPQTFEIIVALNGPGADELGQVAGADRTVVCAAGASSARNAGARIAQGRVLVFVDDDVELGPRALEAHLNAIDGSRRVSLAPCWPTRRAGYAYAIAWNWWGQHYARKNRPGHVWTFRDFTSGNFAMTAEFFSSLGGFDPSFGTARREDWEFGIRVLRGGGRLRAVPEASGKHRYKLSARRLIADALLEGQGDALLARREPALRDGPMGAFGERRNGFWALVARRRQARQAAVAILRLLEWLQLGGLWLSLFQRLRAEAYAEGVRMAGQPPALSERATTTFDLAPGPPIPRTFAVCGTSVGFAWGHRGATVVQLPDGQWDAISIARQLTGSSELAAAISAAAPLPPS